MCLFPLHTIDCMLNWIQTNYRRFKPWKLSSQMTSLTEINLFYIDAVLWSGTDSASYYNTAWICTVAEPSVLWNLNRTLKTFTWYVMIFTILITKYKMELSLWFRHMEKKREGRTRNGNVCSFYAAWIVMPTSTAQVANWPRHAQLDFPLAGNANVSLLWPRACQQTLDIHSSGSRQQKQLKKACMKCEPDHMPSDMNATAEGENYTNKHNIGSRGSGVSRE